MNPKMISDEPITMYELYKEIKAIAKREEELNIRAKKTEEYLQDFATLKISDAEALKKELEELNIPRMKPAYVCKLVDTLPESSEEVKVVLQGYTITISKENLEKIASTVKKYLKA